MLQNNYKDVGFNHVVVNGQFIRRVSSEKRLYGYIKCPFLSTALFGWHITYTYIYTNMNY